MRVDATSSSTLVVPLFDPCVSSLLPILSLWAMWMWHAAAAAEAAVGNVGMSSSSLIL